MEEEPTQIQGVVTDDRGAWLIRNARKYIVNCRDDYDPERGYVLHDLVMGYMLGEGLEASYARKLTAQVFIDI